MNWHWKTHSNRGINRLRFEKFTCVCVFNSVANKSSSDCKRKEKKKKYIKRNKLKLYNLP